MVSTYNYREHLTKRRNDYEESDFQPDMLCWAIGMLHRKRGGKFVKDLRCVKFTMQKGDDNGRFAKTTARGREQTNETKH